MFTLSTAYGSSSQGYQFNSQVNDSGAGVQPHTAQIPAANAGTMASSTTFTVPTGTIANGALIAIFWYVVGVLKGALNCTVTAVSTGSPNDTITVSAASAAYIGGASALPSGGAITVSPAYVADVSFAIANVQGLAVACDQIVSTQFLNASGTSLYVDTRNPAPSEYRYSVSRGDTAPFSGSAASANVYNSATTIANWQLVAVTTT
jgi:hypothetical protein